MRDWGRSVGEQKIERCSALEDLLQADDNKSLSSEVRAFVLAHLRRCAPCRARVLDAVDPLHACAIHLAQRFGEEAQQARRVRFRVRLHGRQQARMHDAAGSPLRRWLPMAAITSAMVLGFLLSRTHEAVVRADELLNHATLVEQRRPLGSDQRVRLRWILPNATPIPALGLASFTTTQDLQDGTATSASTGMPASLARRLAQHRFDWRQPLNVARFTDWRRTLRHEHDEVIARTTVNGAPAWLLRTTTKDDGELREVELLIARETYRVIQETFVFDGGARLEIEELSQWTRHAEPTRTASDVIARTTSGATTITPRLSREAAQEAELDARWVLSETGLDLRRTLRITMSRDRDQIRVEGQLASEAERRMIAARLASVPHVGVSIRTTSKTNGDAFEAARIVHVPPGSPFASWLEQRLVHDADRVAFVTELTEQVAEVRQRLELLQELSERYPESEIRGLPPAARSTWTRLLDRHYGDLRRDLRALDANVRLLGGSVSRESPASQVPADWSPRTAIALRQAVTLDRLVRELVSEPAGDADRAVQPYTAHDLPSSSTSSSREGQDSIKQTFSALWDAVNARQAHGTRPVS
jgi:hypothetical protein